MARFGIGFALGSVLALSVLGLFLFIISALVFYLGDLYGAFGLVGLLVLEAILFIGVWRVSPWVSDKLYEWLYKLRWMTPEELSAQDSQLYKFLEATCKSEGIKTPRFGMIDDENPQAFTYGSDHWNARIVFTKGVFTFLNPDERRAVLAHELGHVVHRDFIVMTLASFILTALYTMGRVFLSSGKSSSNGGRKSGGLAFIGIISLAFYYVGTYVLLYLSRTREYWADEYAREKTGSGNYLASALVKIAYGIVSTVDTEKTKSLMEGTRTLGIYDFNSSKAFGLVGSDYVHNGDKQTVMNAIAFDLKNLWAFWLELSSSHPLTGKRIKQLLENEPSPVFDVRRAEVLDFDVNRHYGEFFADLAMKYLWLFLGVIGLTGFAFGLKAGLAGLLVGIGLGLFLRALYAFPSRAPSSTTIDDLMSDLYASPVRGRPCALNGELVGRGVPGFEFSEDFMFRDSTGLIYLDYQHGIPLLGNLLFAVTKAKSLLGGKAKCKGWFYRGLGQHVALDYLETSDGRIISRQKTLSLLGASAFAAIGLVVIAL